jgi:hypothetical protein
MTVEFPHHTVAIMTSEEVEGQEVERRLSFSLRELDYTFIFSPPSDDPREGATLTYVGDKERGRLVPSKYAEAESWKIAAEKLELNIKNTIKLDRKEIETAIKSGDNCQGRRYLAVTPAREVSIHWADTSRPWDPWVDDAFVIGIPALFPDGEGQEYEMAQECLTDRLGKEKAAEIEKRIYQENGSLVEYADKHHGDWMQAARENQVEWLAEAFLAACNGDGVALNDPAPWGFESDEWDGEVVEPPFEFEWITQTCVCDYPSRSAMSAAQWDAADGHFNVDNLWITHLSLWITF